MRHFKRLFCENFDLRGLILELRRIIKSNRWHYAWLELYAIGLGSELKTFFGANNMLFPFV